MERHLSISLIAALACGLTGCVGKTTAQSSLPAAQFAELISGMSTSKQTNVITTPAEYSADFALYTSDLPLAVDTGGSATASSGVSASTLGTGDSSATMQEGESGTFASTQNDDGGTFSSATGAGASATASGPSGLSPSGPSGSTADPAPSASGHAPGHGGSQSPGHGNSEPPGHMMKKKNKNRE